MKFLRRREPLVKPYNVGTRDAGGHVKIIRPEKLNVPTTGISLAEATRRLGQVARRRA